MIYTIPFRAYLLSDGRLPFASQASAYVIEGAKGQKTKNLWVSRDYTLGFRLIPADVREFVEEHSAEMPLWNEK